MNKSSWPARLAAVAIIAAFSLNLVAQAPERVSDDITTQVPLASPILLVSGALLVAAGSILWLNTDDTNQYWIPGISLVGGGLLSTIAGFAIGGTEDLVVFDVATAIKEGSKTGSTTTGAPQASPEQSTGPADQPSPTPSPQPPAAQ